MENFVYYSPTEFVFGRGVEAETGRVARQHGAQRALIVIGGGSVVRSGLLQRVVASLDEADIAHTLLQGIQPNPTDDKVYEGIALAHSFGADFLLAVGGGSTIDTAKAIAAGAVYEGDFWDFFEGIPVEKALSVGVVLTIPAAGSEGSGNSVITKAALKKKISLRAPLTLRPKFAIMNPELTFTLPPYQTAAGATDMMAHIMERYFSKNENTPLTDELSEAALRTIVKALPAALANPEDYDARATLMWAGTVAHNGSLGVGTIEDWSSHFMEHEISAEYGVTHGAGLAVICPAFLSYVATKRVQKVARWAANVWGVSETTPFATAQAGIAAFRTFLRSVNMPVTFAQLGIAEPDIPLLCSRLHKHKGETFGAYIPLTAIDTEAIYRIAL